MSFKSDVFSFGVTLFEFLTKQAPMEVWFRLLNKPDEIHKEIMKAVLSGKRLPLPDDTPPALAALINECWLEDPSKRPDMAQVRDRLSQLSAAQNERAPVNSALCFCCDV